MGQIRLDVRGGVVAAGALAAMFFVLGCAAEDDLTVEDEGLVIVATPPVPSAPETAPAAPTVTIDPRRSLVVTEQAIVSRFTFQRVLDQLVAQSGVSGLTSLQLFHQWWDTQNPKPGLGLGPHCDDTVDASGNPTLAGFPYPCRAAAEGLLATRDPFVSPGTNPEEYIPIGLFNRFDLAPGDGSTCGEHRIVYARRAGLTDAFQRNLIIFEAAMPNPHPQQGLKGCKQIADFWADLSKVTNVSARADQLEKFYFVGINGLPPVVSIDNLGAGPSGAGQIRTNQFIAGSLAAGTSVSPWVLREYKLSHPCTGTGPQQVCTGLTVVPATVKNNPFGPLFAAPGAPGVLSPFQTAFVDQVPALAGGTLADIDFESPPEFNAAQSVENASTENNYLANFGSAPSVFRDAIAAKLAEIGSTLTPDDIVARAQSLSCAGCHRLNNNLAIGAGLVSPSSIGFVHISERDTEVVDGQSRFLISPALSDNFLPKRKQVLEDYLNDKLKPTKKPKDPIGGRRTH